MIRRLLLTVLLVAAAAAYAHAQRSDTVYVVHVPRKDPGTATLIAVLVTGGGHLYAGDMETGGFLLATSMFGAIMTVAEPDAAPLGIGMIVGSWIWGIIDAPKAAHRANERLMGARPIATLQRVGVSIPIGPQPVSPVTAPRLRRR